MTRDKTSTSVGVLDPPTTIAERTAIHFASSMPGLDRAHDWQLAELAEARPFFWLRSQDRPPLTLLVVDPRCVVDGYDPELPDAALSQVGASSSSGCVLLATVTVASASEATVNLRAPLLINPQRMLGTQVILEDPRWPVRHALTASDQEGQGGPSHARPEPQGR